MREKHWIGLKLQGKLACLPDSDHTISHAIFKNYAVDEDIITFTVKARLQVLPTRLNLSLWYPNTFPPHCLHHDHTPVTETLSHILNGCYVYKGMYIARHDRIVDLIAKDLSSYVPSSVKMYKNSCVSTNMFRHNNGNDAFSDVTANTPDIVVVDEDSKEVTILEVACTFDHSLEEAFLTKVLKYQRLRDAVIQGTNVNYSCSYLEALAMFISQ